MTQFSIHWILSPNRLSQNRGQVQINYCSEVARPSDLTKVTQRKAFYKSLVEDYPAHEFAIDLAEARALKLVVTEASETLDEVFDNFRLDAHSIKSYVGLVP